MDFNSPTLDRIKLRGDKTIAAELQKREQEGDAKVRTPCPPP